MAPDLPMSALATIAAILFLFIRHIVVLFGRSLGHFEETEEWDEE